MPPTPQQVLTVTEITRRIKGRLEDEFPAVWIAGEISNLRTPASGHLYFTLKDANAQIAGVMFRGSAARLSLKPRDGLAVVAFGDISVYEKQGQYQLIVRDLVPKGLGALQQQFEELKRRLQAEGLFDPARKKPIPALPRRIGVITSPSGAAIRDFLNIIQRRFPNLRIVIYPVRVQGEGAGAEIAAALDHFNALQAAGTLALDVVVLTRGGGSLEDLWAFNEEVVARALARSRLPTISAVGHEIDFTISDFVADLRAPTPSAAAELVVKARQELETQLATYTRQLRQDLQLRLGELRQRYTELATSAVFRQPAELIRQHQQQVDDLAHRLGQAARGVLDDRRARLRLGEEKFKLLSPQARLATWRQRLASGEQRLTGRFGQEWQRVGHAFDAVRGRLELLSPRSTLARGYSITRRRADGHIVRRATDVSPGTVIQTLVAEGEFESAVRDKASTP